MDATTYRLHWMDAAEQGGFDDNTGTYATIDEVREAAVKWLAELLAECGDDEDREGILAGSLVCVTADDASTLVFCDRCADI